MVCIVYDKCTRYNSIGLFCTCDGDIKISSEFGFSPKEKMNYWESFTTFPGRNDLSKQTPDDVIDYEIYSSQRKYSQNSCLARNI